MRNDKIVVSLCAEGTDTVFALSAGRLLAGCAVQKRPTDPLYALLPKIDAESSVEQVLEFRPDVVLVPVDYDSRRSESLAREGVEVIPVGGDTLEQAYDNLRRIGNVLGRAAEAEKIVTKTEYGFSLLADQVRGVDALRTAFFFSREPYTAAGGRSLVGELLRRNRLENIYGDIPRGSACPDLSTLRLTDVQLVLLADYPEELTDEDAIRIGNHTEHALTVFVPGELCRGGAPLARLPEFFRRLNEKIRRFSDDSLAERDKPTYF